MIIMVIGSGGREHATVETFLKSKVVDKLYVIPGNDGIFNRSQQIDPRLKRMALKIESKEDIQKLVSVAHNLKVDFVFVGPEKPLSLGIVDVFENEGIAIVGPSKQAACLEASKAWAKDVMQSLGIPVPEYAHFTNLKQAVDYIHSVSYPVVVKADGLAAGKGSIVTETPKEALSAVELIMVRKKFGEAGERVVIEKRLDGNEFSFFAFTDGETVLPMAWARDYKPVFDNDQGLNTGGMGAYSPYRENERTLTDKVMKKVALPLIHGCREKYGFVYKGILYIGGTFLKENGEIKPYVFEINVRMGDPEAQVIYPRLKTDLVTISLGIIDGTLDQLGKLDWDPKYYLCICATSGKTQGKKGWYHGYPGRYAIGKEISDLEDLLPSTLVFHSGTQWDSKLKRFLTAGGRVLSVVCSDPTLKGARTKAYAEIEKINFKGIHYRKDIGK